MTQGLFPDSKAECVPIKDNASETRLKEPFSRMYGKVGNYVVDQAGTASLESLLLPSLAVVLAQPRLVCCTSTATTWALWAACRKVFARRLCRVPLWYLAFVCAAQDFSLQLSHSAGEKNKDADTLSRLNYPACQDKAAIPSKSTRAHGYRGAFQAME